MTRCEITAASATFVTMPAAAATSRAIATTAAFLEPVDRPGSRRAQRARRRPGERVGGAAPEQLEGHALRRQRRRGPNCDQDDARQDARREDRPPPHQFLHAFPSSARHSIGALRPYG